MFANNLLSYYLVDNGLKVSKDGRTRDIICINFDFGAKSYEETRKKVVNSLDVRLKENGGEELDERVIKLRTLLNKIDAQKNSYVKKSKEDIRTEFYQNGVDIKYVTHDKSGNVKKTETIHYKMLYRSTVRLRLVRVCLFLNDFIRKRMILFTWG
jgi:hypothetical protein